MSALRCTITAVIVILVCAPATAQSVRVERPSPTLVDVVGGTGPSAWRLRYGTTTRAEAVRAVVPLSADRAYFVHGPWLRLLDTSTGTVLGRWRFPNFIEAVDVNGAGLISVRIQLPPWASTRSVTVPFDASVGNVPTWDVGSLLSYRTAEWEAYQLLQSLTIVADPWAQVIPAAAAAAALPSVEDLVTRDPTAPLLRLAFAKLLRDAGDPRANAAFADLLSVPSTDFTEWFRVASTLERMPTPEPALALAAFDRALGDFIRRGLDPRLIDTLISRLVLFSPANPAQSPGADRERFLELLYRLAPTSEATERAWAFHANALARNGDPKADVWRERAATSRRESLFLATIDTQVLHDRYMLLALGSLLAALLLVVTRYAKYTPQRRMRLAAATRNRHREWTSSFGFSYWSRRERGALLIVVVAGWLAMGQSWTYARVMFHAPPVHVGSISPLEEFGSKPQNPERLLLQGLANQSQGLPIEAERVYRALPQFAESWNNLGVILARSGKAEESRQAFNRALEIDPLLPEAVLNTTGEARTYVTQTFQKYVPDGKMIAVPGRERALVAYLGKTWTQRNLRMFLGPLDAFADPGSPSYLANVMIAPTILGGVVLVLFVILSLLLIAFVPSHDVTVPPSRFTEALELVVPGTAAVWRWGGGPVLLAWSTLALTVALQVRLTTPYLLIAVAQPGVMRAFGYNNAGLGDINPPIAYLGAALVLLWLANAALIRYSKPST